MTRNIDSTKKNRYTDNVLVFGDWVTVQEFKNTFPDFPINILTRQLQDRLQNGLHDYVKTDSNQLRISIRGYGIWLVNKMSGIFQLAEDDRIVEADEN